jgi:hypothetical protein
LIIVYLSPFIEWLQRKFSVETESNYADLSQTFPGLIAVMSKPSPGRETPAEIAIRYHWNQLKYCWIICTGDTQQAAGEMIEKMRRESPSQGVQPQFLYGDGHRMIDLFYPNDGGISLLVPDNKINDPIYIQNLIHCIYYDARKQEPSLQESDIIADFTGGTRSMGIGIVLACASPRRRLEYISQIDEVNKIKEIKVSFKLKSQSL